MDLKLVQLVAYTDWVGVMKLKKKMRKGKWVNYDYDWMFKPGAMAEVVKYADGVGPGWYMLVDKEKSKPGNIVYTPLVKELAQYKVELHPYTVRKDALPEFFTDVNQMYDALLNKSGATGVFTDFPDTGVEIFEKRVSKRSFSTIKLICCTNLLQSTSKRKKDLSFCLLTTNTSLPTSIAGDVLQASHNSKAFTNGVFFPLILQNGRATGNWKMTLDTPKHRHQHVLL